MHTSLSAKMAMSIHSLFPLIPLITCSLLPIPGRPADSPAHLTSDLRPTRTPLPSNEPGTNGARTKPPGGHRLSLLGGAATEHGCVPGAGATD